MSILQVKNIETVYYDRLYILKGISLDVNEGEIRVVLGPNGAGKTTLAKTIAGLIKDQPRKGEIIFEGKNIERKEADKISRMGIILVPEDRGVFPELTVEENLKISGWSKGKDEWIFDIFPNLKAKMNEIANNLSGGEQQMAAIARAIMKKPKLLILDEPSLGLSPKLAYELFLTLRKLNEDLKITMLIVEQNARMSIEICHYGYIMENGKFVFEGKSGDLKDNELVKELYLGGSIKRPEKGWKLYKTKRRW